MGTGEAFEFGFCSAVEVKLADTFCEFANKRRHENLGASRFGGDARREDDDFAKEVVAVSDGFAGMQPDANTQRYTEVGGRKRALDTDRAPQAVVR
jgi:hypothetical protein